MNAATVPECTLVVRPHPFDSDTAFARIPAGQTIAQMLGPNTSHSLCVSVGGHKVPSAFWGVTRPKAGQTIHVVNIPQGGGNDSKFLRLAATVALMYFTYGAGGGMFVTEGGMFAAGSVSAGFLAAGIGIVGSMSGPALNAQEVQP